MPNRPEVQNKGQGYRKNPNTGQAMGPGTSHKGVSRQIRENKRTEAEIRNEHTDPYKRRSFWREYGFTRQSQAANIVTSTVCDVNQQAAANKQRAKDWPMVKDELTGPEKLLLDIFGSTN
jgi:hypothetical protein